MSSMAARPQRELSARDQQRLDEAYRRLREAVSAYQEYLGRELTPGEPLAAVRLEELAQAQAAVDAAEEHLWRLREELLGQARPPWAPPATLVTDWFSKEDEAYDEAPGS